jgi:hypothetical protein
LRYIFNESRLGGRITPFTSSSLECV